MGGKSVAYYRVSTKRQGRSGLGLEAQQQAVRAYLDTGHVRLIAEFVEVESGKAAVRPQLASALAACRIYGATLVVAKLDRLSRDAAFLLALRDSRVEFVAVDMPEANRMTVGIMAVIAEHEREMISSRTKAALAAARRRGVQLGNPANLSRTAREKGTEASARVRAEVARERAHDLIGLIKPLRDCGASLREIAGDLDAQQVPTARGVRWTATAVKRVMERAACY